MPAPRKPDQASPKLTSFNLLSDPNRTVFASHVWFKIRAPKLGETYCG